MSALEKIRKHPGLLITIIGVAIVIFILQAIWDSKSNGPRRSDQTVAVVDGEPILIGEFENLKNRKVEITRENMKRTYGTDLSQSQTYEIYNTTLEQMIKDRVMSKEFEAVGMNISNAEVYDLFMGDEPHEWVASNFRDEQGNFNRENVAEYIQWLESENAREENRMQWTEFENAVKEDRLGKKFESLVKASYFVPTKLAEKYYTNKNEKTQAEVIGLRYNPSDSVEVTDQDVKKYYQEYKYLFETPATRDIEYVVFDITPSAEDDEAALKFVTDIKDEFAATDNVMNFVNANSEPDRRYDSTWKGRKDVLPAIESVIFDEGHQPGFVYGPYVDKQSYNLVRIVDFQNRADSLKASHILIPYAGAMYSEDTVTTKEMAQKRADSIANVLKKNSKDTKLFGQLASKFSSDKGSAEKEGDLDWFTDGMMVYNFNEFVMNNAVGQIGVVETPFGFHVIKVTGKTEMKPKARLAVLTHNVNTSSKTYKDMFFQVNKFANENRSYDKFNAAIEAEGLTKRVYPNLYTSTNAITGIDNARPIVRWAFDKKTKVHDVSTVFEFDDMFVVAALTDATEEGADPIEKVKKDERTMNKIANAKRGEIAVSKMQACGDDYDRMVRDLGAETANLSDVNMETRYVSNFGDEAKVLGIILGMKEGEVVGPIAGNTAAFIIKNVKHQEAAPATDYSSILREKKAQFDNKVFRGDIYNALRDKAGVEDYRVKFY